MMNARLDDNNNIYKPTHSYTLVLSHSSSLRFVDVTKAPPTTFTLTCHSTHPFFMAQSSLNHDSLLSDPHPEYAEIVVVRHGETAWNADGRIQGHLDVELNEVGRQQAASVADRLSREPKISVIYSSDLQRAFETAQIIASRCGGLEVIKDYDLRERHLGDLQGLVSREAAKTNPMAYKALVSKNEDQELPVDLEEAVERHVQRIYRKLSVTDGSLQGGGESIVQLYDRCTSALLRIGSKHKGERIMIVTHGGFIRSLYKWACPNGRHAGKIHNTSVNVFHLHGEDKWTLKVWGDISHLHQTGFLQSGFGGDRTSA